MSELRASSHNDMKGIVRKYISVAVFLLALLASGGCVRNEIKVDFKLPENVNDAYKITYYASDPVKGWYVETVAAVQRGKVRIVCATRNPTIVFIMESGSMPRAAFYAERGDKIKITGDSRDPLSWNISGNKLTEEWSRWRLESRSALASGDPVKINRVVSNYVKKNSERPLSTLLLLIYFDRRADEAGFHELWGMLKDKALEPKWMQLVSRSDILREAPAFAGKPDTIILHTYGNGIDTLKLGQKPMLLYFWRENDPRRSESIGILGDLVKEFPDSASRVMADVCFDPDSIGWQSVIIRDSLDKVIRGWNFHGETDSVMMRAGVERTPWFIVFDARGKRTYAGDNPHRADSIFRKQLLKQ